MFSSHYLQLRRVAYLNPSMGQTCLLPATAAAPKVSHLTVRGHPTVGLLIVELALGTSVGGNFGSDGLGARRILVLVRGNLTNRRLDALTAVGRTVLQE